LKNIKNTKNYRSGGDVGENPTTAHTPGETPGPLADHLIFNNPYNPDLDPPVQIIAQAQKCLTIQS